jgi:hypothetical protein
MAHAARLDLLHIGSFLYDLFIRYHFPQSLTCYTGFTATLPRWSSPCSSLLRPRCLGWSMQKSIISFWVLPCTFPPIGIHSLAIPHHVLRTLQ